MIQSKQFIFERSSFYLLDVCTLNINIHSLIFFLKGGKYVCEKTSSVQPIHDYESCGGEVMWKVLSRGSFYSWPKVATDIPRSAVLGHVPMQCLALLFVLNQPSVFSHVE